MKRQWWMLTEEEVARLNPPIQVHVFDENDNEYESVVYHPDWQPVGYIPSPRTRFDWFLYHLIHGLAMRYPLHKVVGFAFANTKPSETIVCVNRGYVTEMDIADTGMTFDEFVTWLKEAKP